jgi:hypothetical protein
MAISFPSNPTLNQLYSSGGYTWYWDGAEWKTYYNNTLVVTGDATGTGTVNSVSLTLSNTGVAAGTYTKLTVSSKGLVTNATSLTASDVISALGYTPINNNSPTFTGTVGGITAAMVGLGNVANESKITMFASPAAIGSLVPAAGTFTNLTASGTVSLTSNGTVIITSTTTGTINNFNIGATTPGTGAFTTLSATGNITSSAGNITASTGLVYDSLGSVRSVPINNQTSAYVILASDAGKCISITTGGVTINQNTFNPGDTVTIYNSSSTSQTITSGSGVTMYWVGTSITGTRTLAQRGLASLFCVSTNIYVITGGGMT